LLQRNLLLQFTLAEPATAGRAPAKL